MALFQRDNVESPAGCQVVAVDHVPVDALCELTQQGALANGTRAIQDDDQLPGQSSSENLVICTHIFRVCSKCFPLFRLCVPCLQSPVR
jgi:hypothetical protein